MVDGEAPTTSGPPRSADRRRRALIDVKTSYEGGMPLIRVAGEVDLSTAAVLREAIENAAASRPEKVVIDMSAVTFIDSTGLNVLLTASARENLVVRAPSRPVRLLGEVVGLAGVLSLEP